jgi:putative transposase
VISDNGTELTSRSILEWQNESGVGWHCIAPGKPTDNAFIEAFNDRLRAERINTHWFLTLADAWEMLEHCRRLQRGKTTRRHREQSPITR